MSGNFNRRLAKIEQALAEMAQQKIISNCNCREKHEKFWGDDAKLEAELKLTCPVHVERRLARMFSAVIVENGRAIPNPRRDPLVAEYFRRYDRQLEHMDDND